MFSNIRNFYKHILMKNIVWNIALYSNENHFSFYNCLKSPIKIFSSRQLIKTLKHVHTRADPFLFVRNNELFLFFEVMEINQPGHIEVIKTKDLKDFENMGIVLKEKHHLSYPLVVKSRESIYMIPESASIGETYLYGFNEFPNGLKKIRVLLKGTYFDTSIILHEGIWYLFATSKKGLDLFYTDCIEHGEIIEHPCSPITTDPKISRCAGQPIIVGGVLYRLAQDGSNKYGANLHALKILSLNPFSYSEVIAYENYFQCNEKWNSQGGHHLSLALFQGKTIIAVDGQQYDFMVNKILSTAFRGLKKFSLFMQ